MMPTHTTPQVEQFYEKTVAEAGTQLGFLKAQIKGEGNQESQRALDDTSALHTKGLVTWQTHLIIHSSRPLPCMQLRGRSP